MPKVSTPANAEKIITGAGEGAALPAVTAENVNADQAGNGEQTKALDAAAPVLTHAIKAGPAKGFHRAGKLWTREETRINRADFTDEQWEALEAEPMLTIQQL